MVRHLQVSRLAVAVRNKIRGIEVYCCSPVAHYNKQKVFTLCSLCLLCGEKKFFKF